MTHGIIYFGKEQLDKKKKQNDIISTFATLNGEIDDGNQRKSEGRIRCIYSVIGGIWRVCIKYRD